MNQAAPAASLSRAPLLTTKLFVPRLRPNLVARPQLITRLNAVHREKLTLVSAPAGFGKTTLLSAWAHTQRQPLAWITLDETDNDPAHFLAYLLAALQQIAPGIGSAASTILAAGPMPPSDVIVAALINDLAGLPDDFVVVFDDFHVIAALAIYAIVQALVAHQPPQMHLVIATREDPPLPLARLRARGDLIELRAADLRFTPAETAAFLNEAMGLSLEQQAINQLDTQIEGWIAGLQLAGLSLQHRAHPEELIAGISGAHHFILTYLTEEVLHQLSPRTQAFLMETSILTELTGALCDAVTATTGSDAVLEELYTANIFVTPLDDAHRWYRYHHLFADLLRSQLHRAQPQAASVLHQRASAWYEAQGAAEKAIEHAFAADDYARSVRLLEAHARRIILQGYAQTVEEWLHRLPQTWRITGPRANIAFAWSLLLRGQIAAIEPYLSNAATAVASQGDMPTDVEAQAIAAEVHALRAALTSLRGDTERGCLLAREALALAPAGDTHVQGITLFCLGTACNYAGRVAEAIAAYQAALPLCRATGNIVAAMLIVANLSLLYVACGQLRAAAQLCTEVLESLEQSAAPLPPPVATVYGSYSTVLCEWNQLPEALHHAEVGLTISQRGGHVAALAYGHTLVSHIRQAQNDLPAARQSLQQARALLHNVMPAWVKMEITAQEIALALASADEIAAMHILTQAGVSSRGPFSHTAEPVQIAHLRVLLDQGRRTPRGEFLHAAIALAGYLLVAAEPAGRIGRVVEVLALRALAFAAQDALAPALQDLRRLLPLVEPEGYVRLFLNEGPPMADLLRQLQTQGVNSAYLADLLAQFPPPAASSAPLAPDLDQRLIEPLSARELDVLRLIAQGLSYEEIATQLIVSVNTVRFHIKSIYGKLGVNKRTLAIEQARALRLL